MMFTSGTQAIQGRTVNHDPAPWLVTRGVYRGRYVSQSAIPIQHAVIRDDPRHEYGVLDNPILAAFRDDLNTARDRERDSDVIADWINALDGDDSGLSVSVPSAASEQIDHARRVLEKLVAFDAR
jgi:hypothetical protein